MNHPAVQIKNLDFTYPGQSQKSFSALNLCVDRGLRFGLFGPNGAGKTTLMNVMTGLLEANGGSVHLMGCDIRQNKKEVRKLFGFVPQDFSFYHELSPVENLQFFGSWYGLDKKMTRTRIEELMEVLDLNEVRNVPVHKFSGGMKRKVNLAIGVINQPQILFLDEPTVGVDVDTRHSIIQYLKELNNKGTTLIYTSHQLYEAEDLCDKIALIDRGKIIAFDALESLLDEHKEEGLEGLFIKLTGKLFRDSDV